MLEKQLERIEKYIEKHMYSEKEILNLSEAAAYAGVSKSYLYKKTSSRQIPFYRPATKLIFFKRIELDAWLLQNRHSTLEEMAEISLGRKSISKIKIKHDERR